jgi:hypothetical protein
MNTTSAVTQQSSQRELRRPTPAVPGRARGSPCRCGLALAAVCLAMALLAACSSGAAPPVETAAPQVVVPAGAPAATLPVETAGPQVVVPAGAPAATPTLAAPTGGMADEFVDVTDATGAITVRVPASWTEVASSPWTLNGQEVGISLQVTSSAEKFANWDAGGVFLALSRPEADSTPQQLLDRYGFAQRYCTYGGRKDYVSDDGVMAGSMDSYSNCGNSGASLYQVAALDVDGTVMMLLQFVGADPAEWAAWDTFAFRLALDKVP